MKYPTSAKTFPLILLSSALVASAVFGCSGGAKNSEGPSDASDNNGGNPPAPTGMSPDDVSAWSGDEPRPELTGESTLGVTLTASRVEAVAPAAIRFTHDGP